MSLKGSTQSFSILRGEGEEAELEAYDLELDEGTVSVVKPLPIKVAVVVE